MTTMTALFVILALLALQAPAADFDPRVVLRETRDGVLIEDLVFRNSQETYTAAYRVCSLNSAGPRAAVLYVHWYDPGHADSNRTQFLDEAVSLAGRGACSLLVGTMWSEPDWFRSRDLAKDSSATERQRDRLRSALDFLLSGPGIDPKRVAFVGHDFGGMFGALLAASEARISAWAFQAATPRWHEWYLLGRKLDGAERDAVISATADLDPIANIGKASGTFLFQFATNDEYVPRERAEEFVAAAPEGKKLLWYDAGHGLNDKAREDRFKWLLGELGLK